MHRDVYQSLFAEIVEGELAPGTRLVESAIAGRFAVSRTPVREALRRLEQDGLVDRNSRGLVVREWSPEEILEIYSVRVELEGLAARLAAQYRTHLDEAKLEECHDRMSSLRGDPNDDGAMTALNLQFHRMLWEASHNHVLVDILNRLNSQVARYPSTTLTLPGRWSAALAEHRALLDAVTRMDIDGAGAIAERHMAAARDLRLQLYSWRRP